jgi:uncharacterized membrane protein
MTYYLAMMCRSVRTLSAGQWTSLLAVAALGSSSLCLAAKPPTFSVQILGNISNAEYAYVYGINNAGDAVGEVGGSASTCPNSCAVIWHGVTPTLLEQVQGAEGYGFLSINNSGQVAGTVEFPDLNDLAVTWINGTPTLLSAPTAQFYESYAFSINDSGQIVGSVQGGNNVGGGVAVVGTVWNGLTPSLLDTPPGCGAESSARGINNNGLIVGTVDCYGYLLEPAVVWRGTTVTLLQEPNDQGAYGFAFAVNDVGLAVGSASHANGIQAAAWPRGIFTYLGTLPNGSTSSATAVNTQGVIVGTSNIAPQSTEIHAVVWNAVGADAQDLNTLIGPEVAEQITLTTPTGINNHCAIVVNGYNQTKKLGPKVPAAFLLTPTDPSSCGIGL